ncbi:MAG: flavoprotein [Elusimicrobiota bacterium]|jgi:phosphopantothenoylcysteine decarboxylase/phosphopantothenate--cysteine ligase|nr:flavoprotein [Elusimicrobiota bacterium]
MKKNVLFMLSGSIACYKACNLISRLVKEGHSVKTACTKNALNFIGAPTLAGLSGKSVYYDAFAQKDDKIEHISLSKWADIAVLAPATANIINKMAAGIADDCVSTLFLSHDFKKPFFIAPAMNKNMYLHPATQAAMAKLKEWGVRVLPAEKGRQACGDNGEGRMLEPRQIYEFLLEYLK